MICVHSFNHFHGTFISLDAGKWSDSRPGRFTAHGNSPRFPLYRRQGGPQSRSGRYGEDKNLFPLLRISNPDSMIIQPVA
jgi:hypothetical protein